MKTIVLNILLSLFIIGEVAGKKEYTFIPIQSFHFTEREQLSPNTFRVPFKNAGRLIIVQAMIDGQSGNFIFDTGAPDLILNSNHFKGSALLTSNKRGGVTGGIDEVYNGQIDTFRLESYLIVDKLVEVFNMTHIEEKKKTKILGLLGAKVYEDFEIMIDYAKKQLTFSRTNKNGLKIDGNIYQERPEDSLKIQVRNHILIVRAKVGKKKLMLGLDSGAEFNLLHHKVNRKVLDHFEIRKRANLSGTGNRKVEVLAGLLKDLECGQLKCKPMRTLLMSMNQINKTSSVQLDGVLGFEFLFPLRVAINYKRKQVYLYQRNFRP